MYFFVETLGLSESKPSEGYQFLLLEGGVSLSGDSSRGDRVFPVDLSLVVTEVSLKVCVEDLRRQCLRKVKWVSLRPRFFPVTIPQGA